LVGIGGILLDELTEVSVTSHAHHTDGDLEESFEASLLVLSEGNPGSLSEFFGLGLTSFELSLLDLSIFFDLLLELLLGLLSLLHPSFLFGIGHAIVPFSPCVFLESSQGSESSSSTWSRWLFCALWSSWLSFAESLFADFDLLSITLSVKFALVESSSSITWCWWLRLALSSIWHSSTESGFAFSLQIKVVTSVS